MMFIATGFVSPISGKEYEMGRSCSSMVKGKAWRVLVGKP
jgi:hypothetical protein